MASKSKKSKPITGNDDDSGSEDNEQDKKLLEDILKKTGGDDDSDSDDEKGKKKPDSAIKKPVAKPQPVKESPAPKPTITPIAAPPKAASPVTSTPPGSAGFVKKPIVSEAPKTSPGKKSPAKKGRKDSENSGDDDESGNELVDRLLKENADDDDDEEEKEPKRKKDTTPGSADKHVIQAHSPAALSDPLQIIDEYERERFGANPKLNLQLEDNRKYSVTKLSRITLSRLKKIGDAFLAGERSFGKPSCLICSHFLFVGTEKGAVRVFSATEEESKPIIIKEGQNHKIACMDANKQNTFLALGYDNGMVIIYDLAKMSTYKVMNSGQIHACSVLSIKFMKSDKKLTIISGDIQGNVNITEFSKGTFTISTNLSVLAKNRFAFGISPLGIQPPPSVKIDESLSLVAIADVNTVLIAMTEPQIKTLWDYKKRANVTKGLPIVDWGKGVLPGNPETPSLLLAIAWDRIIQLVDVRDPLQKDSGYVMDGFFESKNEIVGMHFLADNVLVIITATDDVKLLYTGNFKAGRYQEYMVTISKNVEKSEAELESEAVNKVVKQHVTIGKIEAGESMISDSNKKTNYQQSFGIKPHQLYVLEENDILSLKVLTWREFLENLRISSKVIPSYSAALDFYNKKLIGFADFPEGKENREVTIAGYMKEFLPKSLQQHIDMGSKGGSEDPIKILLQITIELCLGMSLENYLLTDIFKLLSDKDKTEGKKHLEADFCETIEPFILHNKFREMPVC